MLLDHILHHLVWTVNKCEWLKTWYVAWKVLVSVSISYEGNQKVDFKAYL